MQSTLAAFRNIWVYSLFSSALPAGCKQHGERQRQNKAEAHLSVYCGLCSTFTSSELTFEVRSDWNKWSALACVLVALLELVFTWVQVQAKTVLQGPRLHGGWGGGNWPRDQEGNLHGCCPQYLDCMDKKLAFTSTLQGLKPFFPSLSSFYCIFLITKKQNKQTRKKMV